MRAGLARHRVTIEEPTITQNEYNEPVEAWATFATWDCSISPLTSREFFSSQQLAGDLTHKLLGRFVPGVTSRMRVKCGSRIFHILAPPINADERNVTLELICRETA